MNKMNKFKGYIPKKGTLLLEIKEKTQGGIILLEGSSVEDDFMIAAVADDVTEFKPGQYVLGSGGGAFALTVDGKMYFQVYASSIMGVIEEGHKVSSNITKVNPN